ncbi:hypothetical protein N9L68_03710 [bacterium]|nr:hypothetical protein [bacterium]
MGGSAWELKIDTERLQEKENNNLEQYRERRNKQIYFQMHRNHDPSALSTLQILPIHDRSALPSDYERREAFEKAANSQSIGPVNVSEPQGAQNSNSGRAEAAILNTFIFLEPPEGPLGSLQPGIPTKHQAWAPARFFQKP